MAYYSPEVMAGRMYLVKPRDFVRSYDMNLLRDAAHTVYNAMIEKGRTPYDEDLEFYLSQWPKLEYKSGISTDHLFIKRKVCEYLYKKYVYTYRHSGKSVRRVERAISYCKRKLDELIERDEEVYWNFPVKHIDHNLPAEFLMEMLETVKILPHIKYKYPLQTMTERIDSRCTGCYKIMPLPTLKREVVKEIPNPEYFPLYFVDYRALFGNVVRPSWPSIVVFGLSRKEIWFYRFYDMKLDMKIYTMGEIHDVALYDVDGDGLCEVLVLTEKSLSIYDNDGKLIKQITLPAGKRWAKLNIVDGRIIVYARANAYCFDFDLKQIWYRAFATETDYVTTGCFAENLYVRCESNRVVAVDLENGSIAWEVSEEDGLPPDRAEGVASTYERKTNKFIGFVSLHRNYGGWVSVTRIDKYGNIELVKERICDLPGPVLFWFSHSGDTNGNGIEEAVFEDLNTFTVVVDPLTLSPYGCFYAVDPDYTFVLTRIFLADYTGDGTIDIIASETAGNNIVIRNYKGEILESWFTGYLNPAILGIGDVDMDHKAELVVGWSTYPEEESRLAIVE